MAWEQQEWIAGVYLSGPPQQRGYSLENPNLPLNSPEVWEQIFGSELSTEAGISVNEDTALMYAPVWQAVTLISSAVACLPFNHYRRLPDVSATASERLQSIQDYLVSVTPSGGVDPDDYLTAVQFWEMFMVDALLWNNAYAFISYDNAGRPKQLRLLNPDRTNAERVNGQLLYVTEYMLAGVPKLQALYPWEVLHIRGLSAYGIQAPRFIKYARNSIALGLAQQQYASKFFKNGGRVGGILELPAGMPKPVRDTVEEGFRRSYEQGDSPFKTVILRDSAKFHQAQISPRESQMSEGTEDQVRMVARWFGLSPAMLGVPGSVSYNSKEQDNQAFLDHCLKRWLRKISAECGIKLLTPQRQSREFFCHDVSDLISLDAGKQATAYQVYRQIGVLSPNEIRAKLNMLPYEGGDRYDNPATSSPNNSPAAEPVDDMPADDMPEEPMDMDRQRDWRAARVLFNLTHVARQKSRNRRSFVEWLDGGFKPQRDEWRELSGQDSEPQFFVTLASDFAAMVNTITEDALASRVSEITLTYEQNYGTPIQ